MTSIGDKLREKVSKLQRGKIGGSISMKEMDKIMKEVGISSGIFEKPVKKKDGGKVQKLEGGGLTGGQEKLDKNKDGKISGEDFKLMEDGGPVKMGSGGGICRGMGAARAGGKFKIR